MIGGGDRASSAGILSSSRRACRLHTAAAKFRNIARNFANDRQGYPTVKTAVAQ
jgi:hypothetical protein